MIQSRLFKEIARFKRGLLLGGTGVVAGAFAAAVMVMFGSDSDLWVTVLLTLASILFWSGAVSIFTLFRVPKESRAIRRRSRACTLTNEELPRGRGNAASASTIGAARSLSGGLPQPATPCPGPSGD